MKKKLMDAVVVLGIVFFVGVTAEATVITNPTGINGIIDPNGSITAERGNYSSTAFNANSNRMVFQFEESQGYPGNLGGDFGDIVLTEAVSGIDFSANLTGLYNTSGWWTRQYNSSYASSGTNSIVFKTDTVDDPQVLTFSTGVQGVGFVLFISTDYTMTCKFYSDIEGTMLLQEYAANSTEVGALGRAVVFVGYENESTSIQRVELYYAKTGTGADDQWNMDDLAVITVPEPATMSLVGAGILALMYRKSNKKR